ncbi:flagellar hook protein FlgE [Halomonas shantousis]
MGFSQALSGVNAASTQLDAIGNNISNSQTKGFKSSSVQFADVFAGSKGGLGTRVAGVLQNFNNGTLETTNRDLDLAISGDGFFRFNQGGQVGYSRNGQLTMTKDGYLQNAQSAQLMGYNITGFNTETASVPTGGEPEIIQLPSEAMKAQKTTESLAAMSLDASDKVPETTPFNTQDASSYNYSTSTTFYDSQGNANNLQMYFVKAGANNWNVESRVTLGENNTFPKKVDSSATYPGGIAPYTAQGGNKTYPFTVGGQAYEATVTDATATTDASGSVTGYSGGSISYQSVLDDVTLAFNQNGDLVAATGAVNNKTIGSRQLGESAVKFSFNGQNGSAPMDFSFDFAGSTQTSQDYAISAPRQDGYASGQLVGIEFADDGTIVGNYTNEQSIALGRMALATFGNEEGLQSMGNNMWAETGASGVAVMGTAGTGQFGTVESGTLEASNVDLTKELVDLIIAQRNFQANTNTIKTQDEVLQTVVNLK